MAGPDKDWLISSSVGQDAFKHAAVASHQSHPRPFCFETTTRNDITRADAEMFHLDLASLLVTLSPSSTLLDLPLHTLFGPGLPLLDLWRCCCLWPCLFSLYREQVILPARILDGVRPYRSYLCLCISNYSSIIARVWICMRPAVLLTINNADDRTRQT